MLSQQYQVTPAGIIPAFLTITVTRYYGGKTYPRSSKVFGEKEAVTAAAQVTTFGPLPLQNVDVDVLLDGKVVDTVKTDFWGVAYYVFNQGIPKGSHTIRMWFRGNFWYGEAYADQSITTVSMTEATFTAFVTSLAVSIGEAEASVMDQTLGKEIGVQMIEATVDSERVCYIFRMWVAEEPTVQIFWWAVVLIIIAAIAVGIYGVQVVMVYLLGMYVAPDGTRFTSCGAYMAYMAEHYPDIWEQIKDRNPCYVPTPPSPMEWVKWAAIGGVAIVGGLIIYEVVKKV
jgi:hypothetical protein